MIVCMSRRICVEMYNAIIKLRPEWASAPNDDDNEKSCVAKIVMTGSAEDGPQWNSVAHCEDNPIGDSARQRAEWSMLAAQQIVGEV